ncbi:MAG: GNAT family N-acetyltransferase [Solirubrobacterales bacterium]|nr:GNAT family N-acetyltransferase [Solirubrobacterales bacterium]
MENSIEVPARIEGEGVSLRPIEEHDIPAWAAAFRDDPDLGPAWGIEENPGEEELRDRMSSLREAAAAGRAVELTIADVGEDRLIGSVILHSFDWAHEHAEVGFWLLADDRGRGLASEGVALMVDWAFRELGLHRVEMITLPALPHIEDVRALASRLGFREEGLMRGRNFERGWRYDTLMLAVLRDEWSPPASG